MIQKSGRKLLRTCFLEFAIATLVVSLPDILRYIVFQGETGSPPSPHSGKIICCHNFTWILIFPS
jgi:hypothetical protein